jgi:flavin-dependent dehydrogenase
MTRFPRSKPCAAGLTQYAVDLLGSDAEALTHDVSRRLRVQIGGTRLLWTGAETLVRTTARKELDPLLARRAGEAGAAIEFGTRLNALSERSDGVRVEAGGRSFEARFLVGADGPRSTAARLAGLGSQPLCGAAYVRVSPRDPSDLERFRGEVVFDPTATRRGYGWIFPKRDHLNVGVYSQRAFGRWVLRNLASYVRSSGFASWEARGPFAAPIPSGVRRTLARGRVLLAGDAAGLVDTITGEGISRAMQSGRIAAESVAAALRGEGDSSAAGAGDASALYVSRVRSEIVPTLNGVRAIGNALYSLGPRGIERVASLPPARFIVRRLGRWQSPRRSGGTLVVEST